jgi:hypothetical protein
MQRYYASVIGLNAHFQHRRNVKIQMDYRQFCRITQVEILPLFHEILTVENHGVQLSLHKQITNIRANTFLL